MKVLKKLSAVLTAMLLMAVVCVPALAKEGNVEYVGGADKFIFSSEDEENPTNLFPDFKGVMPGDKLTQQIIVKNNGANKLRATIYLRSLGAQEDTDEFLSQLKLTVKENGNTGLFEAPADQKAQLTEWTSLGTVQYGGSVTLDVTLEVPMELESKYMDSVGIIDWQFNVTELPDPTPSPVDTGDTNGFMLWIIVAAAAAGVLTVTLVSRKRA